MTSCPVLLPNDIPDNIITSSNINLIRLSTRNTAVGTVVNITCHEGRTLNGASQLTCLNTGAWDQNPPTCSVNPVTSSTPTTSTGLSQTELIVVGVVGAICALVLVLVIVMLCACWCARRKQRRGKRPASDYSLSEVDRYRPYTMYSPFPQGERMYRHEGSSRGVPFVSYASSLPRGAPVSVGSFPRSTHQSAYELQTRSAAVRPKPYTNYAGPRIYKAGSDTYEDYVASRVDESPRASGYDNEGFRGEWTDRYDRKQMNDFNREAYNLGRDPFLWDNKAPSSGY